MDDDDLLAVGVVVERDRGSLPFTLIHGESLVACAAWALGEAGIRLLDLSTPWEAVREAGLSLVWHDSLCPMTPPDFLAACVRRALTDGVVTAGVHVVTDTVKELVETPGGPIVGVTHDRDELRHLTSPVVLPPAVVARLDDWPSSDLREAVASVASQHRVVWLEAPPSARRVRDADDVLALAAITRR